MARRRRRADRARSLSGEPVSVEVDNLSADCRGVARVDGRPVFISDALPGEQVECRYTAKRRDYDEAVVHRLVRTSPDRVEPRCAAYGRCGGCALQHLAPAAQIEFKLAQLLEHYRRIGKVSPQTVSEPVTGPVWAYRHKARLGVRYVPRKEQVLVGFRERQSTFITDMSRCEILHPAVGERIGALRELLSALNLYRQVAQIEVAVAQPLPVLVLRNLAPFDSEDLDRLGDFARRHALALCQQPGGVDTITPIHPPTLQLEYRLDEYDLCFAFSPTDFTQINPEINQRMVALALDWLAVGRQHRVLDLFCGIGNFSLPLARSAAYVLGVEGVAAMTRKAVDNAERNGLDNVEFVTRNLADGDDPMHWLHDGFNRLLLDPPRSGAAEVIRRLGGSGIDRIVYVSCHPATLARDAGVLVNELGYRLARTTVLDMFPHTAHVESIALFTR